MIVVCYGLPGTGKTTVARQVAERLNCPLLSTDTIRKKLLTKATYTIEERNLVYRAIFCMVEFAVEHLEHVVLDGTFNMHGRRVEAHQLAAELGLPIVFVECVCDEPTALHRIQTRTHTDSEATVDTYRVLKAGWEDNAFAHIKIDTARPVAENVKVIERFVSEALAAG
jgi:predicted kinase